MEFLTMRILSSRRKRYSASLKARSMENAVVVVEDINYHCSLPADIAKGKGRHFEQQAAFAERKIPFHSMDLKAVLRETLRQHVRENLNAAVFTMIKEEGHEAIFLPSHHWDLRPIELIWASVKGVAGRKYTTTSTFKDVLDRLKALFDNLSNHTVQGCIERANLHLDKLYKAYQGRRRQR